MKMGRVVLIGLILVLVPVFAFAQPPASRPAPPPPSTLGNLRVSLIEGDVQIKTVDTGEWAPTSINIPLKEGDELWVPEAGRMEIQIMPATFVRLDQISSLAVMTVNKRCRATLFDPRPCLYQFQSGPRRDDSDRHSSLIRPGLWQGRFQDGRDRTGLHRCLCAGWDCLCREQKRKNDGGGRQRPLAQGGNGCRPGSPGSWR